MQNFTIGTTLALNNLAVISSIDWQGGIPIANGGTAATTVDGVAVSLGIAAQHSPVFVGNPTTPNFVLTNNSTKIANTSFATDSIILAAKPNRLQFEAKIDASPSHPNDFGISGTPTSGWLASVVHGGTTFNSMYLTDNDFALYNGTDWLRIAHSLPAVIFGNNEITSNNGNISINSNFNGSTNSITTLGTLGTGTWHGSTAAVLYGGTGATNTTNARNNLGLITFDSPTFTGTPTCPNVLSTDFSGSAVNTSSVIGVTDNKLSGYATKDSPSFNGVPTSSTSTSTDNSTRIATTSFVHTKAQGISLPSSILNYKGLVNAGSSSPTNAGASGFPQTGWLYKVSAPGNSAFGFLAQIGDMVVYDGSAWQLISSQAPNLVNTDSFFSSTENNNLITVNLASTITGGVGHKVTANSGGRITNINSATTMANYGITDGISNISTPITGTPTVPTASLSESSFQIASTTYVLNNHYTINPNRNAYANIGASYLFSLANHVHGSDTTLTGTASPSFSGTPTAPTASTGDNSSAIATTAFICNRTYNGFYYRGTADATKSTPESATGRTSVPGDCYIVNNAGSNVNDPYFSSVTGIWHMEYSGNSSVGGAGLSARGGAGFSYGNAKFGTWCGSCSGEGDAFVADYYSTIESYVGQAAIEFWVKLDPSQSSKAYIYSYNPRPTPIHGANIYEETGVVFGVLANYNNTGRLGIAYRDNSNIGTLNFVSCDFSILDNTWHYIAIATDGYPTTSLVVSVDGVPRISTSLNMYYLWHTYIEGEISASHIGDLFLWNCTGFLDEIRVTAGSGAINNRPLTNRGLTSATTLPMGTWPESANDNPAFWPWIGPIYVGDIIAYLDINGSTTWKRLGNKKPSDYVNSTGISQNETGNTTGLNLITLTNPGTGLFKLTTINSYGQVTGHTNITSSDIVNYLGYTPWRATYTPLLKGGDTLTGNIILYNETQTINSLGSQSNTVNINVSTANMIAIDITGTSTLSFSDWPSNIGYVVFLQISGGSIYTITWPTLNWIKSDGTIKSTPTRSLATDDVVMLWSRDGGSTIYAKLI